MKAKDIIGLMNKWAMPELIDSWDNTGFQIGDDNKEVKKILLALDLDSKVLEKAINDDFQMIITHHPLIFQPIKSITNLNYKGKLIQELIKNEILVYNAHSNLDQAKGGVNDELAKLLGLKNSKILSENHFKEINSYGYGKVGDIDNVNLEEYLDFVKKKLKINNLIVYGDLNKKISRVAVCGGSGSSFIDDAYRENACIYITGDIKYHDAQLADQLGLTLIDPGHYHTEKVILPVVKEYMLEKSDELYIEVWDKPSPEYRIY